MEVKFSEWCTNLTPPRVGIQNFVTTSRLVITLQYHSVSQIGEITTYAQKRYTNDA